MEPLQTGLLVTHITFGVLAFAGAGAALITKFADAPHDWHRHAGRAFFIAMAGIFVTGMTMAAMNGNLAMLFISLFSFYLAWMGRRYAINRKGMATRLDRLVVSGALVIFLSMAAYGGWLVLSGAGAGVVLVVFGGIGLAGAAGDLRIMRGGGVKGRDRIAEHLGKMLGGTIAIVTAFVVTNIRTEPVFIAWLAPAVVLTPVIAWWTSRVRGGIVRKGM